MNFSLKSNTEYLTLVNFLKQHTQRAYLVGGYVRDYYLNKQSTDIDIEVYDIEPSLFEKLMEELGAKGVGKSFFVYKFGCFDISLGRVEKKIGKGHRGFSVDVTNDTKTASKRRDFTMNAIMINIFTYEVVDHYNGLEDLHNSLIRHIDDTTFIEDSLRVLRAVQFSSRFNFTIESKTENLCKEISLDDLSKERVFLEFDKFLKSQYKLKGLKYIFSLKILEKLFSINLSEKERNKFIEYMKDSQGYYDFFYYLREVSGCEITFLLDRLKAPKSFYTFFKTQPKIADVDKIKDLLKLALEIPLTQWIGINHSKFYFQVKDLEIFSEKFCPKITATTLLKEGFAGKELGEELRKRELEEIEELYGREMGTTN